MPVAEVQINPELVRRLLRDQHDDLADLPLVELANGWDNMLFRLGTNFTVRLPRRLLAAKLTENEQRWLPVIGPDLPLATPIPIRTGRPTDYYPWAWSVLPWFEGSAVGLDVPSDDGRMARELGAFLGALHIAAPADAPDNPFRGGPLAARDEVTTKRIEALAEVLDPAEVTARWREFVAVPAWQGPPLWLHGDLHPFNLVADQGALRAVIDFGDITAGDPATDLAVAFSMFQPDHRPLFRSAAMSDERPIDDAMWARAEGWALSVGLAIVASSGDNRHMFELGMRMIGPS